MSYALFFAMGVLLGIGLAGVIGRDYKAMADFHEADARIWENMCHKASTELVHLQCDAVERGYATRISHERIRWQHPRERRLAK